MKKIVYISAITILAACSQPKDKKTELADLKKQRTEIDVKIVKLEAELGNSDTSNS